jgi:hypothetical protein
MLDYQRVKMKVGPPIFFKKKTHKKAFSLCFRPPQSSPVKEAIEDLDDYRL